MGAIIEMIGAFMIAALLTLLVLQMQVNAYQTDANSKYTFSLQAHSSVFKEVMRSHIKSAGFNLTDFENVIVVVEPSEMRFLTDLDDDGLPDTISVEVKAYETDEDPTPMNPLDKAIVITTNGVQETVEVYGVTDFAFAYFDVDNTPTTLPADVRIVGFSYKMLSREPLSYDRSDTDPLNYAMSIAEERVFLKNVWDW
ncbi:MAG: hypothetical protein K8R90_05685 [Candidatus Cloacimonetes bacterium]|nr:hypothetical protein [Candidatus Cloacimonadota bacterium]